VKTLRISTMSMLTWKDLKTAHLIRDGVYSLDVTVKSGYQAFAPTWKMVTDYKKGKITEEEYTRRYLNLMRTSFQIYPQRWAEALQLAINNHVLILLCYCKEGDFCHRHLLKEYLKKYFEGEGYEVEIIAEI
jgi:uncharacterized protein YeaO (DUF488 family)